MIARVSQTLSQVATVMARRARQTWARPTAQLRLSAIVMAMTAGVPLPGFLVIGLPVIGVLMAAPALAQSRTSADQVEREFWASVKDSQNALEVQAYLDRFPRGAFAPEARARLDTLRVVPGTSPRATPPVVAAPPVTPVVAQGAQPPALAPLPALGAKTVLKTAATITEVQELLYNFNYNPGATRGVLNDETRRAISRWQKTVKLPETGDMTSEQLVRLQRGQKITTWGAIGYSWTGATGAVWLRPTRKDAEDEARRLCEEGAGRQCSVVAFTKTNCGVAVHAPGEQRRSNAYANWASSIADARDNVMGQCIRSAASADACVVRKTVCADGSHVQKTP